MVRIPVSVSFRRAPIRFPSALLATLAGIALLAGCGSSASNAHSQTVNALWYGKQPDGRIAQGITPVEVSTSSASEGSFNVDLSGMADAGTGDYWNAAAASAAAVGALGAAVDPNTLQVAFKVDESIDGPSAGGLLTVAVSSDLAGQQVASGKSMTGTVMPDGSLGPVGGIPAKIRAAGQAGMTTVVIPAGQRMSTDPESRAVIDVVDQGKTLGIEVVEAASIADAYTAIVGPLATTPQAQPGPMDPDLIALLTEQAAAAIAEIKRTPVQRGTGSQVTYQRLVDSVNEAVQLAQPALKADPVKAYAASTETLQLVLGWNAGVQAGTAQSLIDKAAALKTQTETAIAQASQTPVDKVEQVPALVDALSWGVDALAQIQVAMQALQTAPTPDEIKQTASTLAQAQYDIEQYLPTAVKAVQATGKTALADTHSAWTFMNGYAALLGRAAQANRDYIKQSAGNGQAGNDDAKYSEALMQLWQTQNQNSDQAQTAAKVATALSAYIGTSLEVNGAGVIAATNSTDLTPSNVQIAKRDNFDRQVKTAVQLGNHQLQVLAGAGLDTSYSQWGTQWGELMSSAPNTVKIADEIRREGLTYQWFANVEAKMLTALGRAIPSNP